MPPLYPKMRERPLEFRINYEAPLAEGLVFAGLGGRGCVGSMVYPDSSPYHHNGTLTNMDAATDWVWIAQLERWGMVGGPNKRIEFTSRDWLHTTDFTWTSWLKTTRTANSTSEYPLGYRYNTGAGAGGWYVTIPAWYAPNDVLRIVINHSGTDVSYNSISTFVQMTEYKHTAIRKVGTTIDFFVGGTIDVSRVASSAAIQYGTPNNTTLFARRVGGYGTTWYTSTDLSLVDASIYARGLLDSEISALADPSNVDLRVSGVPLILPPRRRFWPVVSEQALPKMVPWHLFQQVGV